MKWHELTCYTFSVIHAKTNDKRVKTLLNEVDENHLKKEQLSSLLRRLPFIKVTMSVIKRITSQKHTCLIVCF